MTNLTWAEIMPRTTLTDAIQTFQNFNIPQNGTMKKLIIVLDGLQNGATDSTDLAGITKLTTLRLFGSAVKTEVTGQDLVRFNEHAWNHRTLTMVGEADNEGIANSLEMPFSPMMDGAGNIDHRYPYGAGPGQVTQIQLVTAANQAAIDTGFGTVYAEVDRDMKGNYLWNQWKEKDRTAIDEAVETDIIADLQHLLGWGAFITNGIKDIATAVPDDLDIRNVTPTSGGAAIYATINSTALIRGGIGFMAGANAATAATAANYDFLWLDTGLRVGGMRLQGNETMRVVEGNTGATRRYNLGLGV